MYRYRSLEAWKRAHAAAVTILRATDARRQPPAWAIFDQLRRAAVSVEANIVEGYALGTIPLYQRHLRIAMGSAAEAETLINLAGELGYLDEECARGIARQLGEAMRSLYGLIRGQAAPRGQPGPAQRRPSTEPSRPTPHTPRLRTL